jgi:hypothetical protein
VEDNAWAVEKSLRHRLAEARRFTSVWAQLNAIGTATSHGGSAWRPVKSLHDDESMSKCAVTREVRAVAAPKKQHAHHEVVRLIIREIGCARVHATLHISCHANAQQHG